MLLLSWREGNWASEDVDSKYMGHGRIWGWGGGGGAVVVGLYWSH